MKSIKRVILYLLITIPLFSDYHINNGKVFYRNDKLEKNKFITEMKSMKDVDIPTFKRLTAFYAVDGKKVYYKGEAVEGIDRNSFEIIRLDLAKDKDNLYFGNNKLDISSKGFSFLGNISNAPSAQVGINTSVYLKNFESIYYSVFDIEKNKVIKIKKIENADKNSFKSLKNDFAMDKGSVYYKGEKLEGVTYSQIEILEKSDKVDDRKVPGYRK
jgi:hypothetical protein